MKSDVDARLAALILDTGAELGLSGLTLDDDGFRSLTFDDRVTANLQLIGGGNRLALFSSLGTVPEEDRERTLETLLKANHFWMATFGATFSLSDEEPAEVVLAAELPWESMTAAALTERIRRFVDVADRWMSFLQGTGDFAGAIDDQTVLGDFVRV